MFRFPVLAVVAVSALAFAQPDPLPVAPTPRKPGEPPPPAPEPKPIAPAPDFEKRIEELRKLLETIDLPAEEPKEEPKEEPMPTTVPALPGRVGATKSKLIREGGGNDSSERAVALGLAWLARQQKADGGWPVDDADKGDRAAATGLALLPYLGAGFTHKPSRGGGESKYQKTVAAGLTYLAKMCPKEGKFDSAKTLTGQAIAALAMCEAYGMTRDPELKQYAQAALNYLQKQQTKEGGWADVADGKADIAVAGWVMQAFFAAKTSKDLIIDDRVIKKAITFLDSVSAGKRKETYGTTSADDAKPGTTPTATGLWCRYHFDKWGPTHAGTIDGVAGLAKSPPSEKNRDPLYLYYATWNVLRFEGEDWKNWNEGPKTADGTRKGGARDLLATAQIRKADEPFKHGSWDAEGEWGKRYGRLGTTALNLLTLEVYYRYLPLYKRGVDNPSKIIEDLK